MKLKHFLIVSFIVLSAFPLLLSLMYLNQHAGVHYRMQIEDKLSALSQVAKKRVLAAVDRVHDTTALIGSRTQLRASLQQWNRSSDKEAARKNIARIIYDAIAAQSRIKGIGIYDIDNRLVSSSGFVVQDKPQVLPGPNGSATIELKSLDNNLYVSSIDLLRLQGKVIGYIQVNLKADFLLDLVGDRSGLGETGEWLLAKRQANGDALFVVPLKYDPHAAFKRKVDKGRQDVPIIQALSGHERIMAAAPDYRDTAVMASTRYIAALDWGLVAKIDESEVNSMIQEINLVIYWLEGAIILLAIIFGVAVSFYISKPIERLSHYTNEVAKGKFVEFQQRKGWWREVKDLSSHFNLMIGSLRELHDNLNQMVVERTKELDEANKLLTELSVKDPLTGLYNRRYLDERMHQEIDRARRYDQSLAFVMLDIDYFKSVNDTWGHDKGDEVLVSLSRYLKSAVRNSDVVARFGGEEFCLVLPSTERHAALSFLERVRADIERMIYETAEASFKITCSFGLAYLELGDTRDSLMKKADKALYQAKTSGRNRTVMYVDEG